MGITHSKVSGEANPVDITLIGGEDWDDTHVIDWAEASELVAVGPITAGTGTTVPRADHGHRDSAAGRVFAFQNFR